LCVADKRMAGRAKIPEGSLDRISSRRTREIISVSDWLKKTRVLNETAGCFGVPLSSQQASLVSNILGAMEARIPSHVWRDTPPEALSALHLRNLIDSGAIPPDRLNAKGWDALEFANEMVEKGLRSMGHDMGSKT